MAAGSAALSEDLSIQADVMTQKAEKLRREGETVLAVAVDGEAAALIGVADPMKGNAQDAIRRLTASGLRVLMVTGDNATTAAAIAGRPGIEFRADVQPGQKAEVFAEFERRGHLVAMAGDGINDAPALARASVGHCHGHRDRCGH